jgi:hypothetical protein
MSPESLIELRERWTGSRERLARMLDAMDVNMRAKHGHGLPPEVMALGNGFHPEPVVLGLLDDRDRLAARVIELEAPGECQSLHKLRAEVVRVEAERDAAVESARVLRLNVIALMSDIAEAHEDAESLLADRDELAAELAALTHGTGEGAINEHWTCTSWGNFTRTLPNGAELRASASGWATYSPDGLLKDHYDISIERDTQRLPRVNMRAAEAAARSRGWM